MRRRARRVTSRRSPRPQLAEGAVAQGMAVRRQGLGQQLLAVGPLDGRPARDDRPARRRRADALAAPTRSNDCCSDPCRPVNPPSVRHSRCPSLTADLVHVSGEEVCVSSVHRPLRQGDRLARPLAGVELLTVAELVAQPGTDDQSLTVRVDAEVAAVEQRVHVRPQQQPWVSACRSVTAVRPPGRGARQAAGRARGHPAPQGSGRRTGPSPWRRWPG